MRLKSFKQVIIYGKFGRNGIRQQRPQLTEAEEHMSYVLLGNGLVVLVLYKSIIN